MTPVIDILNRDRKDLPYYMLGNCLRGYVYGYFENDEVAFAALAERFDRSYPSKSGRVVEFWHCLSVKATPGGAVVEDAHG